MNYGSRLTSKSMSVSNFDFFFVTVFGTVIRKQSPCRRLPAFELKFRGQSMHVDMEIAPNEFEYFPDGHKIQEEFPNSDL